MTRLNERALFILLAAVLAGLIFNAANSYRATNRLIENERMVAHTHEVLGELATVVSAITDAESGQRGYIITGKERYLAPYGSDVVVVEDHFQRLKALTADNPRQQRRLALLEPRLRTRLAMLREGVRIRRTEGAEAARAFVQSGRGQTEMRQLRTLASDMQDEELYLLSRRSLESKASGRSALLSNTLSNSVLVAAFGLLYLLLRRGFKEREQAEAELRAAHGLLESKVEERTAELAQANEKLETFAGELQRSNRELQDFAFVASHDLQEPLRKIQAFGDRLKSKHGEALSPEGRDYLERMQAAALRMHALINDLLTFSRVTSKGQPFVSIDLDRVAREVLSDLEVRVQENGGRVEVGDLPTLEADPLQMRQLLQNLIGNGLKFRRAGEPPVVRVNSQVTSDERPRVTLEVSDNGIGFDTKYLDRIFTPFQRLHGRSEYEGTGMGLAVCRRIVERHGGTITARSTPGEGATFVVELPQYQGVERKWQPANPS